MAAERAPLPYSRFACPPGRRHCARPGCKTPRPLLCVAAFTEHRGWQCRTDEDSAAHVQDAAFQAFIFSIDAKRVSVAHETSRFRWGTSTELTNKKHKDARMSKSILACSEKRIACGISLATTLAPSRSGRGAFQWGSAIGASMQASLRFLSHVREVDAHGMPRGPRCC